jgi:tetraacyldisaccharide 4'-kinase
VVAAQRAIAKHLCDTLILDDGFQYLRLERDENIVLVDAANPFGSGHLLPRGVLREPVEALSRATEIVLTRCDQATGLVALGARISALAPGVAVRMTHHAPIGLRRLAGGDEKPLSFIDGKEVSAVCAIGNPDAFMTTLKALGARISRQVVLADHAPLSSHVIPKQGMVVTTEKDAVRFAEPPDNLWALEIALQDFRPNS